MAFSVRIYDERNALIDRFVVRNQSALNKIEDADLYRVMITPDDAFLSDLEDKTEIRFQDGSFFFKGLSIDKVTFLDRFEAGNHIALFADKIQRTRGKELKYLLQLTSQKERTVMQLKEILTSTGKRGQAKVIVDWLCTDEKCANLSLPCEKGSYCYQHCVQCELYKDCRFAPVLENAIISTHSYLHLWSQIPDIEKKIGPLKEKTKRALLSYRIYNDFLRASAEDKPQAARGVRFAIVSELLTEISPYLDNILFKPEGEFGAITRRLVLDLCEWGITKFINSANGFAAAQVSTDHFAYGLFGTLERQWRRHPNVIIIENMDRLQICRGYYGRLFIPVDSTPDFWKWFQRLETAIYKETDEEKSREIGKKIFDEFGGNIIRTVGDTIKIIDYGGGRGIVLATFLDAFLPKLQGNLSLEIKLIDLDRLSLDFANIIIPKVLEKHGFNGRVFSTIQEDIFKSYVERADIAIVSQVLDLYTKLRFLKFPREYSRFAQPLVNMLENVLRDKMETSPEEGQRWTHTLGVAKDLLSIYYFMAARVSGLIGEEKIDLKKRYFLQLDFESDKIRWVKEVAKYSQHMIVADRVVDANLLREWGIAAKSAGATHRFFLSKSSKG